MGIRYWYQLISLFLVGVLSCVLSWARWQTATDELDRSVALAMVILFCLVWAGHALHAYRVGSEIERLLFFGSQYLAEAQQAQLIGDQDDALRASRYCLSVLNQIMEVAEEESIRLSESQLATVENLTDRLNSCAVQLAVRPVAIAESGIEALRA